MHEKFGLFSYDLTKFMEKKLRTVTTICDRYVLRYKFLGPNLISPITKIPIQAHKLFWTHTNISYILPTYYPSILHIITQLRLPQIFLI